MLGIASVFKCFFFVFQPILSFLLNYSGLETGSPDTGSSEVFLFCFATVCTSPGLSFKELLLEEFASYPADESASSFRC